MFAQIIEKHLQKRTWLSWILFPFSILYGFMQLLRRQIYTLLPALSYQSKVKIISIGNIISGGSGKTPFTIFLAKYLQKKNKQVAISMRGYKGKYENTIQLIATRKEILKYANDAGDEPYMVVTKLQNIPVIVGKNRKLAIKTLTTIYNDLDYIILDDSFQHLQVKHDYDFVLFNQTNKIGNGFVLPAGLLREFLSALTCSDFIVYNGENRVPKFLTKYNKPIIKTSYQINSFFDESGNVVSLKKLQKSSIILLSGIGNPVSFEKTVQKADLNFKKHFRFSDHCQYTFDNLQKVKNYLTKFEIDYVLTTEKDFSKLKFIDNLELPLVMLALKVKLESGDYPILETILNR